MYTGVALVMQGTEHSDKQRYALGVVIIIGSLSTYVEVNSAGRDECGRHRQPNWG